MEEKISGQSIENTTSDAIVKDVTKVLKKVTISSIENDGNITLPGLEKVENSSNSYSTGETSKEMGTLGNSSKFKVCTTTALAKPTVWTKIKNTLFAEIKVELTPHQQKIENEINEFLHKEITWQSIKAFWTKEIKIKL